MTRFGASILDAEGPRLNRDEAAFFRDADPLGFILFARNLDTADQIRALCGEMRSAVGRQAPILIDQEGGRVQRLRPPLARNWLPPLEFVAAAGPDAERACYLRGRLIAAELADLGIDVNCVPTLDLAFDDTHDFLRNRCLGSDPGQVAVLGRALARGHLDGGVLPVVKHLPGHGRARLDSHFGLPHTDAPLDVLNATDFAPFRALADLPLGMTGHVVFDALSPRPATLSADVIALIRGSIGFDGLLMTDDISMRALDGSLADISRQAIAAGCDAVLCCNQSLADRRAVAEAAGTLSEAAQIRAETALSARCAQQPLDIAAAEAELSALMRPGWGNV